MLPAMLFLAEQSSTPELRNRRPGNLRYGSGWEWGGDCCHTATEMTVTVIVITAKFSVHSVCWALC